MACPEVRLTTLIIMPFFYKEMFMGVISLESMQIITAFLIQDNNGHVLLRGEFSYFLHCHV